MRPFRIQSWAAAVSLAGACTLAGPASAPAAPNRAALDYVALGDSYSAGVGAGDYLPEGASCLRSSRAYPALWASTHASSFAFAACNGAKTGDVLNKQLGALSGRTNLVSVTAGGSDASWAKVMGICALPGTKACLNAIDTARAYVDKTLPANLDRLYSGIRGKAPGARVVVLGYPHFYQLHGTCARGLEDTERAALNAAIDHLDGVIAQHATGHGFAFADARSAFDGHEICSAGPWLRSVEVLDLTESYHPNASGQSLGYLPLFTRAA
ncbi:SGNH/GDSL hydrolase family protein [Streptomyces murinus]|uniref:SGNH/GDSL hydrolase family protein n=1 Tax=Streptomyces murinus TaxID=33900 RepID=UPI000A3B547C|nr:SGNH/GDSL hydrolase family protein [Streptomyces murinus]